MRLPIEVLADGVETAEQHECVVQFGWDLAQGAVYSPALTAEQLAHTPFCSSPGQ